ncbi:cation transporter [Allopusillimonas ginsengisoli]|uniref:cation transporter n=1 Tax=Allopusillimonas ginsengisoli TaxID=453575 RepID=UPI0039C1D10D
MKKTDISDERESGEDNSELDPNDAGQRRALIKVLFINLAQAIVVGAIGVLANSTSLMGAALDNFADGIVYGLSIYAVGHTVVAKARVARLSGTFLIVLAVGLLLEVLRRFFAAGEPIGSVMIIVALANAATNLFCLRLLRSYRHEDVQLRASWIFTTNDMYVNLGIAASGVAVILFQSSLPDLLIGLVVVAIALKGGWEILEQARDALRPATSTTSGPRS